MREEEDEVSGICIRHVTEAFVERHLLVEEVERERTHVFP